ncbi:MAG: cytochrome c [Acidobacteriaceae bacterium]
MDRVLSRLARACRWLALLILPLFAPRASLAASSPALERGSVTFRNSGCPRCHSITGVGGTRGPDLEAVGLRRSPVQIRRQIMHGGHGMPPFGRVLGQRDIDDLVEFLSSCRTDKAPGCRRWAAPPTNQVASPEGSSGSSPQ